MAARPLVVFTGGAGFVGSHMVDLLVDQGSRADSVDRRDAPLRDAGSIARATEPWFAMLSREGR